MSFVGGGEVVGSAEVLIHANSAGFATELKAQTDPALASVAATSGLAGEAAGAELTGGMSKGTKTLGEDATKKLKTETGKMEGVLGDLQKKSSSILQGFGVPASLASGPKIAALAGAAVAAISLKMASDMQTATTAISNSEGITVKAAQNVGDAFIATGGKSEYSGIQQAQAFATVAGELKATQGQALSTAQAVTFMGTAGELAKAKQIDLGTATSTLAGIMQAFQIDSKGAAGAANVLYNASNITGQGVDVLASSLERVRGRLGTMAPPLKDLTALVVDFTKQGITGRGALTGLQGSYTALAGAATGTTKANLLAKQMLAEYGVQVVDTHGKLASMSSIIDALGPKYATMTQAQQLQTSTLIFGSTAAKQMTQVIDAGTKSYDAASTAVSKHNALQKAAEAQSKTLAGQWAIAKTQVIDLATSLGGLLIPAFTGLVHAVVPVLDSIVKLIGWFEKGSVPAIAIAGVIAAIVTPAIVKMGISATTSAAESVVAFVTMGRGIQGFGATAAIADEQVVTANEAAAASFETIATAAAADIPMIGASMASISTEVEAADTALVTANEAAGASFLAMLGPIAAVAAAAVLAHGKVQGFVDSVSSKVFGTVNTSSGFQHVYDIAASKVQNDPTKLAELNKKFQQMAKDFGFTFTEEGVKGAKAIMDSLSGRTTAAHRGTSSTGTVTAVHDAFIAPPNTAAQKAASKAQKTSATEAKQDAAAAVKAQNTLTSEIITAVKMPFAEGAKQLEALGVPATKAVSVLHDAVLPFTQAVKALEKAGFDAQDAVKIADAGAKANIAAAKKNAVNTSSSSNATGIMVNGVEVSGAVYDAAIGSAFQQQTGTSLTGSATASPNVVSAPQNDQKRPLSVTISSGAIVINPAPGNDANSIAQTKTYIDQMMRQMINELESGQSAIGTYA